MISVLKDAFKTAFRKPLTWIALIAIPLIVACFGLLYFGTFMSPDERMKELPIAVINKDKGCIIDDEEKNFGRDLSDSLVESDKATWIVESPSLLDKGLENTEYFLAIIIPEDFSEKVAAGQTEDPTQANISFYKNVRKNYTLSTLSSRIESSLKELVNQKIGEQYSQAYLEGLVQAGEGFKEAADGSNSLQSGLNTLKSGSETLSDGANSLLSGTQSLNQGLETLTNGAATLSNAGNTLSEASSQIAQGLISLSSGSDTFSATLTQNQSALTASYGGDPANSIPALQSQYAQALQTYATALYTAGRTGQDPSSISTSELEQTVSNLASAANAAGAYSALEQTLSGYTSIHEGVTSLNASYEAFNSGLASYTSSTDQLSSGIQSAQAGAVTLSNGSAQLNSGAKSLNSGLASAEEGSKTLTTSLEEGANTINDSLTANPETLAEYISQPVDVQEETYGNLEKFGYGFAPLFLTLCIWLGSLIIFFIFDVFPSKQALKASRFAVIFGRWPLYFILSALEVALVLGGAFALGLPCTNTALLIGFFAIMAVSFVCLMQFFNLFDVVGKALAILLVIVQLVFCSGTFPAQLGSDLAVAVGPYLPFYYAIDGIREIMSGGVIANALHDMGILLLFAAIGVALSLLTYPLARKKKLQRDEEIVKALTGKALA